MSKNIIELDNGITISYELVTPETAAEFLAENTDNRKEIPAVTDKYVRALEAGRWIFIGDPVRRSATGRLLDGAHRCRAVRKTGIAIPMIVIRGLPDETQKVMDQGARRSAGQQLSMQGLKNATTLVAVAALLIRHEKGLTFTGSKLALSNDEKSDFVLDNIHAMHFVQNALREATGKGLALARSALGAVAFRVYQIIPPEGFTPPQAEFDGLSDQEAAELHRKLDVEAGERTFDSVDGRGPLDVFRANYFFHALGSGVGLASGSPMMALRNFAIRKRRLDRKISQDQEFYYITRAWNAWRTNQPLQRVLLPNEITPEHWVMR